MTPERARAYLAMWTLDENRQCERTHASFRLGGDHLSPASVEQATGLTGDFGAAKGEIRPSVGALTIKQPTGVWLISSKGRLSSTSLERHLLYLLDTLEPVKESLLAVAREQDAAADFFCYWASLTDQPVGPGVSAATLRRIADFDAILGIDFCGP